MLINPSAGRRGPARARRRRLFSPRRRPDLFVVALVVIAVGVAAYLANAARTANSVDAGIEGVEDGALLTTAGAVALDVVVRVPGEEQRELATVTLDGQPLPDVEPTDEGFRWRPDPEAPLAEGDHVLRLTIPRTLTGTSVTEVRFTVDGTAPALTVPSVLPRVPIDAPVSVAGRVEPGATLTLDGEEVPLDAGAFSVRFDFPPAGPLRLEATDAAGNTTRAEVIVPVTYPGCRGVHVSAAAWNHPELRAGVLRLIDEGKVSCIELTLKDEGGTIGHRSSIPLANEIGATQDMYDLDQVVAELHGRGVRVVGRLVAFRDPVLAGAAWAAGNRDWVVQTTAGEPLPNYGGFTNFANPDVRRYNLDIALEAAEAGVDEVLWDYLRRPEGALESMVFPGLEGDVKASLVDFLDGTHDALRERGVFQGVSVFGIAATRPDAVGQDIPAMARHVDVVAPMVYPSLWVSGEYGVDDPTRMPYEIVKRSLADFQEAAVGTGAWVVPWLQHFNLGHVYGPTEVRAQVQASADLGIHDWLLWSPGVRYDPGGLDPIPGRPTG